MVDESIVESRSFQKIVDPLLFGYLKRSKYYDSLKSLIKESSDLQELFSSDSSLPIKDTLHGKNLEEIIVAFGNNTFEVSPEVYLELGKKLHALADEYSHITSNQINALQRAALNKQVFSHKESDVKQSCNCNVHHDAQAEKSINFSNANVSDNQDMESPRTLSSKKHDIVDSRRSNEKEKSVHNVETSSHVDQQNRGRCLDSKPKSPFPNEHSLSSVGKEYLGKVQNIERELTNNSSGAEFDSNRLDDVKEIYNKDSFDLKTTDNHLVQKRDVQLLDSSETNQHETIQIVRVERDQVRIADLEKKRREEREEAERKRKEHKSKDKGKVDKRASWVSLSDKWSGRSADRDKSISLNKNIDSREKCSKQVVQRSTKDILMENLFGDTNPPKSDKKKSTVNENQTVKQRDLPGLQSSLQLKRKANSRDLSSKSSIGKSISPKRPKVENKGNIGKRIPKKVVSTATNDQSECVFDRIFESISKEQIDLKNKKEHFTAPLPKKGGSKETHKPVVISGVRTTHVNQLVASGHSARVGMVLEKARRIRLRLEHEERMKSDTKQGTRHHITMGSEKKKQNAQPHAFIEHKTSDKFLKTALGYTQHIDNVGLSAEKQTIGSVMTTVPSSSRTTVDPVSDTTQQQFSDANFLPTSTPVIRQCFSPCSISQLNPNEYDSSQYSYSGSFEPKQTVVNESSDDRGDRKPPDDVFLNTHLVPGKQ